MKNLCSIALCALVTFSIGCTHEGAPGGGAETRPVPAVTASVAPDPAAVGEAKPVAPATVTSTSSARSGKVDVSVKLHVLADASRGVARVVVPSGVKVMSGTNEQELGALKKGVDREFKVTLEVPSKGRFQIFSGVDVYISSGFMLHREAEPLILGE